MTTEEEPNWAMITDDELERTVREIRELIPNIGQAQARRKHQKIVGGGIGFQGHFRIDIEKGT